MAAYSWATIYFCFLCFSMIYGKKLIRDIEMQSKISGSVYYTNLLSIPIMFGFALIKNEPSTAMVDFWTVSLTGWTFLLVSAVAGTGISYAGWWCRNETTATLFTLIGVLNKI